MKDDNINHDNELPPRPQEPLPGECCGRNCENCVYVYYERALKRWEERVALILSKAASNNTA